MGNFENDTALNPYEGGFQGELSEDWKHFNLNGGYLCAIALRAAGSVVGEGQRPVSLSAQFLRIANPGPIKVEVRSLYGSEKHNVVSVSIVQNDKPVLDAYVRTTSLQSDDSHQTCPPPSVPLPQDLSTAPEIREAPPVSPLLANFENKVVDRGTTAEPVYAQAPYRLQWKRFLPVAKFDDVFVDAGRPTVLVDIWCFSAFSLSRPNRKIMPVSVDLNITFHHPSSMSEWLLVEARSDVIASSLMYGTASVWNIKRELVASGSTTVFIKHL